MVNRDELNITQRLQEGWVLSPEGIWLRPEDSRLGDWVASLLPSRLEALALRQGIPLRDLDDEVAEAIQATIVRWW